MLRIHDKSGFTLIELLITLTILGIIVTCIYPLSGAFNAYNTIKDQQYLLAHGRYVMERMVLFTQETGKIELAGDKELRISERVLDSYDNATHAYKIDGDGLPDSDNNGSGLIDEGNGDDAEIVRFKLVDNLLMERLPNFGTADQNDYLTERVLSEYVTLFKCSKLAGNVVEINLNLTYKGYELQLKTRAKARFVQ
jgi:prepilin-type N-terminal cleavage/methylation domain-containing protein